MDNQTQSVSNAFGVLADDSRALMAATADVVGEKVSEARKRLATTLENCKEISVHVRDKMVEGAKVADETVHEHPYHALGIAVGVGALVGYLMSRRCGR